MDLPSGTVSFLFTDVQGSTRLLEARGAGYDDLIETHRRILESAVEHHHGSVFETEGDAVFAVFTSAADAVAAAHDGQRDLTAHPWPEGGLVRVRMAVHTGDVRRVGQGYYGMTLHVTARVCSAGHGGQVLVTGTSRALAPDVAVRELGEHRLKDLQDPVPIFQLLGDGLDTSFPPLRSLTAMPSNLPASLDDFVGRDVELAAVLDGLTDHRLVTLTGAGGSGKTRLALQAAAGLLESSRDGVWFVDLTPVNDETRVPAQLADVLGLGERPGKPLDESVAEWLRAHEVLLVFDNCEHLVQGVAAFVDDVLRTCPAVRVLATSREALGVRGELVLPVPPLSLDGEAAALFVTRAMTAVPGLRSSDLDAELVDQVCRRLDGLPLAIELAAARLRSLSQAELAARLDDRFQLLTGGSRTAPSRQRTLEAVVAWGYDLLSADERALFRAVSIFPDSFDLDAAAAVSDGNPLDALDTVARLLDKSFLVKTTTDSGSSRYHLLETLRHYGRDRLRESDEFEARRNDLLAWAMGLVARLERDLLTPAMDAAIAAVMADRANLRVAMEFAMEREDFTAALRIVTAVPADLTGRRRALIVDLLDRGSEQHGDQVVAKSQQTLADLAFEQGDWQQAAQAYEAAWVGFEALGDRRRALWSKHGYCSARWALGDTDVARRLNRECLAELRTLGDEYGIAQTVWLASLLEPDRSTATSLAVEAEGRYTELGSPIMRAHALEARGLIALADGDVDAATAPLREAIAVLAGATNLGCTAHLLEAVAVWASLQGEMEAAGEFVGSAESLRAASGAGHKPWEVRALHGEDFDLRVMGDDDAAHDAARRGRLLSLAAAAELADSALGRATDLARESRREGAGGPR